MLSFQKFVKVRKCSLFSEILFWSGFIAYITLECPWTFWFMLWEALSLQTLDRGWGERRGPLSSWTAFRWWRSGEGWSGCPCSFPWGGFCSPRTWRKLAGHWRGSDPREYNDLEEDEANTVSNDEGINIHVHIPVSVMFHRLPSVHNVMQHTIYAPVSVNFHLCNICTLVGWLVVLYTHRLGGL